MDMTLVEKIANAVLYEGYMLYPYRASSVKNRQRFNWGAVTPRAYSDAHNGTEAWTMKTQCLFTGSPTARLHIRVRFLHLTRREIGTISKAAPHEFELVESIEIGGRLYQSWQEAVERDVEIRLDHTRDDANRTTHFSFPKTRNIEPIPDATGKVVASIIRTQEEVSGEIETTVEPSLENGLYRVTVAIRNTTPFDSASTADREQALLSSLVSTHTVLHVENSEFVSLLEPAEKFEAAAATCTNVGVFPVLVGGNDCMLASPIILYDYPEIAAESPGDLFDSTEIDEILTLRIMTMTDAEKREMRAVDERAKKLLERTEAMSEADLLNLHGALRGLERSKSANG